MILSISDFEITCEKKNDFCCLKFVFNKSQFITVPFDVSRLQNEIIDKLKLFIDHQKEIVINLSSDSSSRIWQIKKEYFLFDLVYEGDGGYHQETYLIGENNSIFRNGVRQFLLNTTCT